MGIVDEDIARVRDAIDIVSVIGEHVALRRVGRRFVGLCPFHGEKSPSFSVNAEQGLYHCFGCSASGDAITFVREMQHLDFVAAVELLAGKAGIALRYDEGTGAGEDRKARDALAHAMADAVEWYHQRLLTGPDAGPARAYLRARGYDGETVRQYRIGWAPDDWDQLCRALKVKEQTLVDAGLGFRNRRNRMQDVFRGRIMFPIFDPSDKAVGFGARIMPGAEGPKYKNSSETKLYRKSSILYGLNWAKATAVRAGEVVLCEGYTDVIGLHRAGIGQAVATCGTALTEDHLRVLQRFARRIVLCFDADSAGQAAAERIYQWERTHEVDFFVAALPPGADPADLAASDPDALKTAVTDAQPFLGFRVDRLLNAGDLSSPEGRARAAEAALGAVVEHPSDLVRDQYVMLIADRCRVSGDQLRARLASGEIKPPPPPVERTVRRAARDDGGSGAGGGADPGRSPAGGGGRSGPRPIPNEDLGAFGGAPAGDEVIDASSGERERGQSRGIHDPLGGPGAEAIRLAVHQPEVMLAWLDDTLVSDERHLAIVRELRDGGSVHDVLDRLDPGAAAVLQRLAVEEPTADPIDVAARLADLKVAALRAELEAEARSAPSPLEYAPVLGWLSGVGERLRESRTAGEAIGELVAWLRDRAEETD